MSHPGPVQSGCPIRCHSFVPPLVVAALLGAPSVAADGLDSCAVYVSLISFSASPTTVAVNVLVVSPGRNVSVAGAPLTSVGIVAVPEVRATPTVELSAVVPAFVTV